MRKDIITVIMIGVVYSLMGFAYMHATFPSKDVLSALKQQVNRIETKLDRLIERRQ